MRDQKNVWRIFFHRKVRNTLRTSKIIFWEEKGTFENLSFMRKGYHFPGTISSQFIPWYVNTEEAKLTMIDFQHATWLGCVNYLTKTCNHGNSYFFNKNLFRVTFSSLSMYVNSFRGWFSSGSKNLFKEVLEKFWSCICTLLLSGPPGDYTICKVHNLHIGKKKLRLVSKHKEQFHWKFWIIFGQWASLSSRKMNKLFKVN